MQQAQKQRLEQQLEEARQAHAKARADYNQAEQDFINTERQIKTETDIGKLATLQARRDALNTIQPRLRREVEKLDAKVSEARNAITRNEEFIRDIRARIANAPSVLDGLQRQKSQAESDVQQAQAELRQTEKAIEAHAAEVRGYESQLDQLGGR
jgi:chromosome segregation ATPase